MYNAEITNAAMRPIILVKKSLFIAQNKTIANLKVFVVTPKTVLAGWS